LFFSVIPAEAGIQDVELLIPPVAELDPGFRRGDASRHLFLEDVPWFIPGVYLKMLGAGGVIFRSSFAFGKVVGSFIGRSIHKEVNT